MQRNSIREYLHQYIVDKNLPIHHFGTNDITMHRSKLENIRLAFTKEGLVFCVLFLLYAPTNTTDDIDMSLIWMEKIIFLWDK